MVKTKDLSSKLVSLSFAFDVIILLRPAGRPGICCCFLFLFVYFVSAKQENYKDLKLPSTVFPSTNKLSLFACIVCLPVSCCCAFCMQVQ